MEIARPAGQAQPFPVAVVGIGGSSGALPACEALFAGLPDDLPVAIVVVLPAETERDAIAPGALARLSPWPVRPAQPGAALQPRVVHLAEAGTVVAVGDGALQVGPAEARQPIDHLFTSLARLGARAVGVLLSGTGDDGTAGLRQLREAGGLALAQDPASARCPDLPRLALGAGAAEQSIAPADIPEAVARRVRLLMAGAPPAVSAEALQAALPEVCQILLERTGRDFAGYKRTTLLRRLERRVQSRQRGSVDEYVQLLQSDPQEVFLLQKDLLIGVTRFFRDPDVFEALRERVVPTLCRRRENGGPIRIWVPACSTGEEAYSLAMLFHEYAERHAACPAVTLFATDVDAGAVEIARRAVYPRQVEQQFPPERRGRYFVPDGGEYRLVDDIRQMCTFAVHDLLKDPPFSRMDLISCRNLFIYFDAAVQARVIPLFHYALAPEGFLLLGPAEGITGPSELFRTIDKKHRLYQRREGVSRPALSFGAFSPARAEARPPARGMTRPTPDRELTRAIAAELLDGFAPPAVVIDEHGEIFFYSGKTARFLDPPTGAPAHNIFDIVARSIRPQVHALVHRALEGEQEALHPNLLMQLPSGGSARVDLIVRPLALQLNDGGAYLVVFRELPAGQDDAPADRPVAIHSSDSVVQQLEAELRDTREHLQSTIEQVKSSNEELLSTNEELQSANEELQTSKEEFQSLNEELETVNGELSRKLDELDRVNSDLQNFFENTRVPTLFLDTQLRIKKFTPSVEQLFRLIPGDIGRPFTDIASSLPTEGLDDDFRKVLRTLGALERELTTSDGSARHFLMRVNPYRTVADVISGVVVTFSDVTELKRAQEREATLAAIVESSSDAIISRDLGGAVTSWNLGAESLFWFRAAEMVGRPFASLLPPELHEPLRRLDDEVREGRPVTGVEVECLRKDGRRLLVSLTLSPIRERGGQLSGLSVIMRDIGEKRRAAIESARLAAIVESSDDAIVSKDLNGVVTSWNPGAERLFGYTAAEMVGTPIYRIVPSDHPEDVPQILAMIAHGERVKNYDTVRVSKTGRRINVSLTVSPLRDETGRIVGASKIARDITDRVRAEDALKRGLALRDEFISVASHELKTPLTTMKIQADRLKRAVARQDPAAFSPERVERLVQQTDRQIARLHKLVEEMLEVSRISTKGLAIHPERFDLSALVQETVELLSSAAGSGASPITTDLPPGVVGCWDRGRLEQVVTNLLTNAYRYGEGRPIRVKVRSDGEWATLTVQDQGIGIAPKDQDRIFDRFERVAGEQVSGGLGVGLYIVKQIASAHGGTVKVHSALGEGATFVVAVPLAVPGGR